MHYKEIRDRADDFVQGNAKTAYSLALIPPLIYGLIAGLIGDGAIASLFTTFLSLLYPILTGVAFLALNRQQLDYSFKQDSRHELGRNGGRYALLAVLTGLYIFLWSLVFIVPGIIKVFAFAMSPFLVRDQGELTANEAIGKSQEMMVGHKLSLFKVYLCLFKWVLLALVASVTGLIVTFRHLLTLNPMDTVGGTDLGMSFVVAVLGGLVMVVFLIRALPRWYAAQVFFYEELKAG